MSGAFTSSHTLRYQKQAMREIRIKASAGCTHIDQPLMPIHGKLFLSKVTKYFRSVRTSMSLPIMQENSYALVQSNYTQLNAVWIVRFSFGLLYLLRAKGPSSVRKEQLTTHEPRLPSLVRRAQTTVCA